MEKIKLNLGNRANDCLIIGANALLDNCTFHAMEEVIYYFEKPHKYKEELEELGFIIEVK